MFLQRGRTFHKTRKVLDGIEPLVEQRIQLLLLLGKLGHFEINIRQFIVEHFLCLSVKQLDFMMKVIGIGIIETKVENANRINGCQLIIPLVPFDCLVTNRESGIENASIFKVLLFSLLHFYQNLGPVNCLTIHIKDSLAVIFLTTQMLRIQIGQITDFFFSMKQGIQKADKQLFIGLCSKQLLKSEVCIEIDITFIVYHNKRNLVG
ncbi:hypothetical protein EVA_14469 [gut metagenome]|uniref:Uncharacterized protein n=1 Tax=gut metagenome TaxID=749906 RepID=J9FR40_9ZZZZ